MSDEVRNEPAAERPLSGCHVLLADDNPSLRGLYRAVLERAGAEVTACPDGETAVEAARAVAGRFGVALLDLVMPGSGGSAAAAALRAAGFVGGIIGLSAMLTQDLATAWLAAGCDMVLPKDVPHSLLIAAVADARRTS